MNEYQFLKDRNEELKIQVGSQAPMMEISLVKVGKYVVILGLTICMHLDLEFVHLGIPWLIDLETIVLCAQP